MADSKISELTAITGANTADDDLLVIVDTSASQTKKITLGELENALAERDFSFGDNDKLTFGAGSDLQIYHDGTHSYVTDEGTGALYLRGAGYVYIQKPDGTQSARFDTDGAVTLFHNNAEKLSTLSTGVNITGTAVTDGLTVAGNLSVDGGTIKLDGNYPTNTGNVALGNTALDSLGAGNYNTAVGHNALTANTDGSNTAFGAFSLAAVTTGGNNVAVGREALEANTGDNNTSVGYQALTSNTTASNNTAVGYQAGYNNTTGYVNTFLGNQSGKTITTGYGNTAAGYLSLENGTTARDSVYVGAYSGRYVTTAVSNTCVGVDAGRDITTGGLNTIIGRYNGNQGGLDIRTSSNNIVLSDGDGTPRLHINNSNILTHTGDKNLLQGTTEFNFVNGYNYTAGSEEVWMNYRGATTALGEYRFWNGKEASGSYIPLKASAFTVSSDYRLKENVVAMTGATERLKQLNPCRFNFKSDDNLKTEITQKDKSATVDGFIAHEVQAVVPEAVTGAKDAVNAEGNPVYQGIDQSKLVPLLVATIKELEARITALENA